jgi:beta-1,4-mannosyltransferase
LILNPSENVEIKITMDECRLIDKVKQSATRLDSLRFCLDSTFNFSDNSERARDYYWSSSFDRACSYYVDLFEANSKAWWLAMEAIRCKRALVPRTEAEKLVVYSPEFVKNSYQRNLYSKFERFKYEVQSVNHLVIDDKLVKATFARRFVFHQHWLKDIYWEAFSEKEGVAAIARHIGILRALKAYGAKICWTLHNIIDHDATPLQEELSAVALQQMAEVSNHIFIHTHGAGELLSSHCGRDLSEKFELLEHPLYDNLLNSTAPCLPEEIKQQEVDGRRILLSVGMIRPYKGVPDLIRAFQQVVLDNKDHGLHLIIAGELDDPEVLETLEGMDKQTRSCISLLARRLQDDELAGLMQTAHVFVTSYKKILTSGSYYLATTFAKPTVAPRMGMFAEIIQEDETGFLYDGSVEDLAALLQRIAVLPETDLARVGENALLACKHLTIAEVSARFFSLLEAEE